MAPIKIFLQWNGDQEPDETVEPDEVTWAGERIWKHDVEYMRADRAEAIIAAANAREARLREALRQVRDGIVIKDGWGTIRVAPMEMVNAGQIPTTADRDSFELMYNFISRALAAADRSSSGTGEKETPK